MKRIIALFIGLFSIFIVDAQCVPEFIDDTIFCITINYYNGRFQEPVTYTSIMSIQEGCHLDLSNHDSLYNSLYKETLAISDLFFSSFDMVKASFPDSTLNFQKETYNNNILKWLYYNSQISIRHKYFTETGDCFIMTVAKIIAVTKQGVGGFPVAIGIIKDVIPVCLNDDCINGNVMELSKDCLSEIKKGNN